MATKTKASKKKQTLAEAKKKAMTPAYQTTGPMAAAAEERLRFYLTDIPQELHAIRASLLPFDDVIQGGCCGADAAEYMRDPSVERRPFFMVSTSDPQNQMNEYEFIVTAAGVTGQLVMHNGKGSAECDIPFQMTLRGLHDFLRQLPRNANAFSC